MSEKRKKVLILGAGRDQIPIITTANKMGLYVIVVSPQGDYDGLKIADKVFYADVLEKEQILDFAHRECIDGVLSDQLDIAVPTVAYVAEKLGLEGIGYGCSQYFTNKFFMRKLCEEIGIPVQKYKQVNNLVCALQAANEIEFPIVIKPVDSSASKGVFKVDNEAELKEKFELAKMESFSGKVLVEEYIQGEQYLSRGYVHDYKLYLFAFSNRYYFNLTNHFLPNQTIFPAKIEEDLKERMADYQNRIIEKTKPKFGAHGVEWIYNREKDTLYLIETAMRGGGAFISSDLIPQAYGIDLQPYLINASLNQYNEDIFKKPILNRSSAYMFFILPQGRVSMVSGLDHIINIKGVFKSFIKSINVGDTISPLSNKASRFGPILISGENRDEVERTIEEVKRTVRIDVETNSGRQEIIWG